MQDSNRVFCWGVFFLVIKKISHKSFTSDNLFSSEKKFKNACTLFTFTYIHYTYIYLIYFRDPEYQNFLWNCTRELLKKYIPSDIDKLLDVKVETNNKH